MKEPDEREMREMTAALRKVVGVIVGAILEEAAATSEAGSMAITMLECVAVGVIYTVAKGASHHEPIVEKLSARILEDLKALTKSVEGGAARVH